ncbi:MAG TPA: hypothetical protein PLQ81_14080, partial [bacterium]|nr:hypothetical protein [bacterium]
LNLEKTKNEIAENLAALTDINQEILKLKKKQSEQSNWLDEIKLNILLKKSYAIAGKIEKNDNDRVLLELLKNKLKNQLIQEYDKRILYLMTIQNKTNENNRDFIKLVYLKKERLISGEYGQDRMEFNDAINRYKKNKTIVLSENNVYVRLGLLQDLIIDLKLKMSDVYSKIKFLNKEVDISQKLIYYFNNNKNDNSFIKELVYKNNILRDMSLKYNRLYNEYNQEYCGLTNEEEELKIALNPK